MRRDNTSAVAVLGLLMLTLLVVAALLIPSLRPHEGEPSGQTAQPSETRSDFSGVSPVEGIQSAPEFGVVVDRSMRVVDLVKGGAAELAGIQRGDVILQIDGTRLTSSVQARQVAMELLTSHPGKAVSVAIDRGGQSVLLQVLPASQADGGDSRDNPVPTVTPVLDPFTYF